MDEIEVKMNIQSLCQPLPSPPPKKRGKGHILDNIEHTHYNKSIRKSMNMIKGITNIFVRLVSWLFKILKAFASMIFLMRRKYDHWVT